MVEHPCCLEHGYAPLTNRHTLIVYLDLKWAQIISNRIFMQIGILMTAEEKFCLNFSHSLETKIETRKYLLMPLSICIPDACRSKTMFKTLEGFRLISLRYQPSALDAPLVLAKRMVAELLFG